MRKAGGALLLAVVVAAACGGGGDRATVTVDTAAGPVELSVEVADDPDERRAGLSGRESLADDAGMLFVYPETRRGGFWMKDTLIPLTIAFLAADGRVLGIVDMEPCRADPCPVYDPGVAYRNALEVPAGALARLGVAVGDVLTVRLSG